MDHNQERRRGHYNRGRRGPDRRGSERRTPPPQAQEHGGRDHVDVEQIMRDIRARIGQRHGIDLSNQQIQELAARRLEAILDPRTIKPALLDELRRSAGSPPPPADPATASELTYTFEDSTMFETHRCVLRFFRKLLNPILKLFFNPNPLIQALNIQSRWNAEIVKRQAERERRHTEWNALQYELLHRMVTEVSRVSIELQGLASQVESLSAKVDFNERRVRSMEGTMHQARPAPRSSEPRSSEPRVSEPRVSEPRVSEPRASEPRTPEPAAVSTGAAGPESPAVERTAPAEGATSDGTRRRRRRRRGRRGSGAPGDAATPQHPGPLAASPVDSGADTDEEDGPEDESSRETQSDQGQPDVIAEPVASADPEVPPIAPPVDAPAPVTPPAFEPAVPAATAEEREPEE
jgi:hypothetical protein